MRTQLETLLKLADEGRIRLQVIPLATPDHPGLCAPFRTMTFEAQPPVAYAERLKGGQVLDAPEEVRDTRHRHLGHLEIPAAEWEAFLAAVRRGEV